MAYGKAARNDQGYGLQYAAMPWRETKEGREVLLITSRESGRWVIPKGWPMKRRAPHEAAAREAFEEAGVRGVVRAEPLGTYTYLKNFKDLLSFRCEVQVFPLQVKRVLARWPEQDQRRRRWFPPARAAELVDEPELKELLRVWAG